MCIFLNCRLVPRFLSKLAAPHRLPPCTCWWVCVSQTRHLHEFELNVPHVCTVGNHLSKHSEIEGGLDNWNYVTEGVHVMSYCIHYAWVVSCIIMKKCIFQRGHFGANYTWFAQVELHCMHTKCYRVWVEHWTTTRMCTTISNQSIFYAYSQ